MSDLSSKQQFLEALNAIGEAWDTLLSETGDDRLVQPGAEGIWSIKDVLIHIAVGYDWTAEQLEAAARGKSPSADEIAAMVRDPMFDNEYRNQAIYEQHRHDALDDVIDAYRLATARLTDAAVRLPEFAYEQPLWWTRGRPLCEALPAQSYAHSREHLDRIIAWLGA